MPRCLINNKEIDVAERVTILQAAESLGIEIPTLCHLKGLDFFTSCMMCVVMDLKTHRLIPACSIFVEEGMAIETDSAAVHAARKDTIDMLLAEHVGDCEATCNRGCPSNMDIPQMIRYIKQSQFREAIALVKKDIPLPAILGRTCSAPCENACIHRLQDSSISICQLERLVADLDLESNQPYLPPVKPATQKKVAVIGAGPTGLSAAYYLRREGHEIVLFDRFKKPGGMMTYGLPAERLDKTILEKEISNLLAIGIEFRGDHELGKNLDFEETQKYFDAVVLALGTIEPGTNYLPGLELSSRGVVVRKQSFQTQLDHVFAGGNAIRSGRSIIRSCAHGKEMAHCVTEYLKHPGEIKAPVSRFNSTLGKLAPGELDEFIKSTPAQSMIGPEGQTDKPLNQDRAILEANRCFHCDCRKKDNCKLRDYADSYLGNQKRFKLTQRPSFQRIEQHNDIVFEPGKCIKCNLCVQITEKSSESIGLAMVNRGFDIRVAPPFGESMNDAISEVASDVVQACPTAALSFKHQNRSWPMDC